MSTNSSDRKPFLGLHSNHIKIALVGLPNSGKSSLFNLLVYRNDASPESVSLFSTADVFARNHTVQDDRLDWLLKM